MGDHSFFDIVVNVHTQNRTDTHLEDLLLGEHVERRIRQGEVRDLRDPLGHVSVSVRIVNRQGVALQGVVLQIELQILPLTTIEQGVFRLRLHQHLSDIIPRIGFDSGIRLDDTIRSQLFEEIIYLRVLDRLRNTLS